MNSNAVLIDPAGYRQTPWKNGGGVTVDIAGAFREDARAGQWDDMIWRFGWTTIAKPAPFSDLSGFDRMQVVVRGHGLVLRTPDADIDVRRAFEPVRFKGSTPINSQLENGPVDVVNLMGDSRLTKIDLRVLQSGATLALTPGIHVLYAANEICSVAVATGGHKIATDWALRLDLTTTETLHAKSGRLIVGSVFLQ